MMSAPARRSLLLLRLLLLLFMPLSCGDALAVEGMACLILELDDPVLYTYVEWVLR
jgi:hypothetical protein